MRARRIIATAAAAGLVFSAGCMVATATSSDSCEGSYVAPMNSTDKLKRYNDCRFDRIDAAQKRIEGRLGATTPAPSQSPTPTPSATPSATPTPTPSPTPTPTPTASTTAPAAFPNGSTTGVPAGATLTSYTGPTIITTAGTVIDSKTITSCLTIKADNVTIRNSLIRGNCFFNVLNEDSKNLVLTDVEIDGLNANPAGAGVGVSNYSCTRCDIHGTGDGAKMSSSTTIRDSFIHDLAFGNDSHNDGVQISDGSTIVLDHNSINPTATNATSAILIKADFGAIANVKVTNNLLAGGAWTVYAGDGFSCCPDATGVVISGNKFSTVVWPKGGYYGPITNTGSGVTVSSNTWADGANVGKPVS
jgi:hypothetical protein